MEKFQNSIPIKVIAPTNPVVKVAKPDDGKIYARAVKGSIENFRRFFGAISLLIFSGLPWLTFNGQQAILLDFSAQKFRLFSVTWWPQDFVLVSWIFIVAAFLLFFVTAVAGRVWCGFMCPQTVYTFLFIWLEEKIEGSRSKRMHLDKQPLSLVKFTKKALKHNAWLAVALFTGLTFIGYFVPIQSLFIEFFTLKLNFWPAFYVILFTFCTYANAGWMREIMCTHMCPYSRFQSAMFDQDTITVTYDSQRGEGRGPRSKKLTRAQNKTNNLGDCIDCNLCVQVCPTGIDIRNGLQYECINCGACVDACNDVMNKMNYPKGLIKFTSESALAGKKANLLRPKVLGYLLVSIVMITVMVIQLIARTELDLNVLRDRNALYRENMGLIENTYTLILINKSQESVNINIEIEGLNYTSITAPLNLTLAANELLKHPVSVAVNPTNIEQAITPFAFVVHSNDLRQTSYAAKQTSTFIYR